MKDRKASLKESLIFSDYSPNLIVLLHESLKLLSLFDSHFSKCSIHIGIEQSLRELGNFKLTASSSRSSSSSGTSGGLKKLKKLSQFSVLMTGLIGLPLFDPFLGRFCRIFCVKHFPGYHSISVLQRSTKDKHQQEFHLN